jgi:hypothetical protein
VAAYQWLVTPFAARVPLVDLRLPVVRFFQPIIEARSLAEPCTRAV